MLLPPEVAIGAFGRIQVCEKRLCLEIFHSPFSPRDQHAVDSRTTLVIWTLLGLCVHICSFLEENVDKPKSREPRMLDQVLS